ncbi:MAG: glycosyltransferase family 2 protein [Actinomycetes bacterium]
MPDVAVVITTYNRSGSVLAAVRSALDHTVPLTAEVVVVDDGSTDATLQVLARLDDPRLVVVAQANAGQTAARNTGLARATAEWVAFLDDDDELLPAWGTALAPLLSDTAAGLVSGPALLVDPDDGAERVEPPVPLGPVWSGATAQLLAGCFVVRREVLQAAGGYLDGLCCSPQTELFVRLTAECERQHRAVRTVEVPVARIERRAQGARAMQRPNLLLDGSRWVLARHARRFALDPDERAGWESLITVAAVRTGRMDVARDFSRRAVRSRPTDPRTWLRALLVRVPPLARRAWSYDDTSDAPSAADRAPLAHAARYGLEHDAPGVDRWFLPWGYDEQVVAGDPVEGLEGAVDPWADLVARREDAGPGGTVAVRVVARRAADLGPPSRPGVVREWTVDELTLLLESAGLRVRRLRRADGTVEVTAFPVATGV